MKNMITKRKAPVRGILIASVLILLYFPDVVQAAGIGNLMVEYTKDPIGIDVEKPRFSWQMEAPEGARGYAQTAYRIVVKDPEGRVMWDTQKVTGEASLGIRYAGEPLGAATRYDWTVTVWDQKGESASESAWFETGLMNPDPGLPAWEGAMWIGGGDGDLVLYSHYLSIYVVKYTLKIEEGSSRAGFVLGANDRRLMDRNRNILQVENGKDEGYIKIELDISGVDGTEGGMAKLNIYRAGYTDTDSETEPIAGFDVKTEFINNDNKYDAHALEVRGTFGNLSLFIDGSGSFYPGQEDRQQGPGGGFGGFGPRGASVNVNPMGSGGDYITFGMLCDMGFSVDAGQKASFSNVQVSFDRIPGNVLFGEDLTKPGYDGIYAGYAGAAGSGLTVADGAYMLDGGSGSVFAVGDPSRNSMPMLRSEFETEDKEIEEARLYVTARGIYEIYLNGERVGEDHYNPGLTQYNKTHMYQTYDVTGMVDRGENAVGAMLGEGWWSGLLSFGSIWNHFGDRQSLLAKLVVTYEDGTRDVVTTNDREWKYCNEGPVIYSSLDMGEVYDATREAAFEGWSRAGYDDGDWKAARKVPLEGTAYLREQEEPAGGGGFGGFGGGSQAFNYDDMLLTGQIGNNAGVFRTLTAESVNEVREGVYVYDMGQNFVGVPRITVRNGKAGDTIVLRYSEILYPDMEEYGDNEGMIMTENYRAALCQDIYIMKDGEQVIQPRFTFRGCQYIEITGPEEALAPEDVQGLAMSSLLELTADYKTSNDRVNRLWSNLVWSNIDNFLTIPTDCPQRNERMGWSGDISVFSRTATYISNADPFLRRHMIAMRDVQTDAGRFTDVAPVGGGFGGILWGSAGITVPWEVYMQYADTGLLEEHYGAMASYIDYLGTTVDPETGLVSDAMLGDWLGPQNNQLGSAFLATAYHAYDLGIMARTAEILGKEADAEKYRNMYALRKAFFNDKFVNEDHKTMGIPGGGFGFVRRPGDSVEPKLADTQSSYAVGLALGAFSDENIPYMAENLAAAVSRENTDDEGIIRPVYSLMTGFIGTAWISKALSDYGYSDQAYRLLQNDQYPSWLYAIDQGATSIWERLNGYTIENGFGGNNSMNSFNHYSFGAVGQWIMAYSLGIQRDEPGFRHFILQPEYDPSGEMTRAEGYYESMYGRIGSAWEVRGGTLEYRATVPANTTATLYLPAASGSGVTEGGKPAAEAEGVGFLRYEEGKAVYELKSGSYTFVTGL